MSPSPDLPPRFELERVLAPGRTFLVREANGGARWVLKRCLAAGPVLRRRLDTLNALPCPGLVREVELLTLAGQQFSLRRYVDGVTLQERCASGNVMAVQQALELLRPLASLLGALHEERFAHGRVHSGNVLITSAGDMLLLDGLDPSLPELAATGPGHSVHAWPAPERLRGKPPTPRGDVYGVGTCLFQLLTGQPPFAGPSWAQVLHRALYEPPAWPTQAGAGVLATLLAKAPRQRPPDGKRLLSALQPSAHQATPWSGALPASGALRAVGLGAGAALVATLAWAAFGGRHPDALEVTVASLLQSGRVAEARQRVAAELRRRGGESPELEKLLGDISCAMREPRECLRHYRRALEADSHWGGDEQLRRNVLALLDVEDRSLPLGEVLSRVDGAEDTLLQEARSERTARRWNAIHALEARGMADRVDYVQAYGMDLVHGSGCARRRAALARLVHLKDPRAIPYVEEARSAAGKPFFGDVCLGRSLDGALQALREGQNT